nr:FeoA family protein [Bordetella sp. FB-8]
MQHLSELPRGTRAVVDHVVHTSEKDAISQRLTDLGFVSGEGVRVAAFGPLGADPILVVIGSTRFALRRSEAARVVVREVGEHV